MDQNDIIAAEPNTPEIECLNKVDLTGSVIHIYRARPSVIILTVAVTGHNVHDVDYPNVVFYGEAMADSIEKAVVIEGKNYPRVRISGYLRTTRKETDEGVRFYQNIVGTNIGRTQTNMESLSGKRNIGSHKIPSVNDICVLGRVTNVFPIRKVGRDQPIGAIVTVRTQANGRINYPRITCFNSLVSKALSLQRGDVICATAFAETTNRDREDGSRMRFESIIATEIETLDAETAAKRKDTDSE